ncbi:MAG: hypothetical protein ABMB14_23515 [Myxococcota bacterium]
MRWIALATVAGCVVGPREGVQIGEENVEDDEPCVFDDQAVGPDDVVFASGETAGAVVAAMPLAAEVAPVWFDGGSATLSIALAATADPWVLRTATLDHGEGSCPAPELRITVAGTVASSDGLLAEDVVFTDVTLTPDEVRPASVQLLPGEIAGALDADALAVDLLGDVERSAVVDLTVELGAGAAAHGALTLAAWPTAGEAPASPDETRTLDLAIW